VARPDLEDKARASGLVQPASTRLQAKPTTSDSENLRKKSPKKKPGSLLGRRVSKPKVSAARLDVHIRGDKRFLDAVGVSMLPETQKSARCTFSVRSDPDGKTLILHFTAKDLIALRASFNTNLRLVSSALKTLESTAKLPR
jgi:tRNA threonylcarbamoyladenosine modification (KEOPS) complex  Pcc1 subunit